MLYIFLVAVVFYILYAKVYKPSRFYKDLNIPYVKPWPLLGNSAKVFFRRETFIEATKALYNAYPHERYYGVFRFSQPMLLIRDLDLIKQITIRDFDHFTDHKGVIQPETDPIFSKNLFSMKGAEWREMRSTLSPAFTSSKMRGMFILMDECAKETAKYFLNKETDLVEIEMKGFFSKFTNDVIATTSFGIKCDSLNNENNEFYKMGLKITTPRFVTQMKLLLLLILPKISKLLKLGLFDKEVGEFFTKIVRETIHTRESQNIVRPDMIHLLMEARKGRLQHDTTKPNDEDTGFATVEESTVGKSNNYQKKALTDNDITAQALIFFVAGFETSSTIMSFMTYELATNPDIQAKLLEEIDDVLNSTDGKPSYEDILKMKYMDQVLSETLRKWTPGVQTDRVCVRDYVIEPKKPHEKPLHIKRGDVIVVPITGIHYDPKYYPNPERFDPDRFSDENKNNIVAGSYLPFGVGPRSCIGSRFALLETKIIFFNLLTYFELTVTDKTQVPIKFQKVGVGLKAEKGFNFGLKRRKNVPAEM